MPKRPIFDDNDEDYLEEDASDAQSMMEIMDEDLEIALWNDRLQNDGSALPHMILKNQKHKNAISPCDEYIRSNPPVSLNDLAVKWVCPINRLSAWSRDQGWARQREEFWQKEAQRLWEASSSDIATLRGRALQRASLNFEQLQTVIMEMAKLGKKQKLYDGEFIYLDYDPRDIQNLTKALLDAHRGELAALGLNLIVQKDASANPDDEQVEPINMMVFNMPATSDEQRRFMAVPRAALEAANQVSDMINNIDIVEGETVETPTAPSQG